MLHCPPVRRLRLLLRHVWGDRCHFSHKHVQNGPTKWKWMMAEVHKEVCECKYLESNIHMGWLLGLLATCISTLKLRPKTSPRFE